jgi:hypothetical protein
MSDPSHSREPQAQLAALMELLERAVLLLRDPSPDRVDEVGKLIEVAAVLIANHQNWSSAISDSDLVLLMSRCRALQVLLENAGKVHWHQMRKMGIALATYTASGTLSNWRRSASTFSIDC